MSDAEAETGGLHNSPTIRRPRADYLRGKSFFEEHMIDKADKYKKLLNSRAVLDGPRSLAGAVKPDRLSAIAERMVADDVAPTADAVHAWLSAFRVRYAQNFFTRQEVEANIRRAQTAKNAPRKSENDSTRKVLREMSALQRLEFANGGMVLREKDKNLVTGNE